MRPSESNRDLPLKAALLFAVVLALYWSGRNFPFVFDTARTINPATGDYIWTNPFNARWLTMVSFQLTSLIGGLNPVWYKLGNMFIHALNATLIYFFTSRVLTFDGQRTGFGEGASLPREIALFGALLFAVHPVNVYAVLYDVQRSILLATCFSLVTWILFLKTLGTGEKKYASYSVIAYFLALHGKEQAIVAPLVCFALAVFFERAPKAALTRYAAIWFCYALAAVPTMAQQGKFFGTSFESTTEFMLKSAVLAPSAADPLAGMAKLSGTDAFAASIVNQGHLFFDYLSTWIFPNLSRLSIDIPTPSPTGFLVWPQSAGFVLFLGYAALTLVLLRRSGKIGVLGLGLASTWILALAEFSVTRLHDNFVLYRSYLWMPFLGALVAGLIFKAFPGRFWGRAALLCALAVLAFLARDRIESFRDEITLWDDTTAKIDAHDPALFGTGAYRPFVQAGTHHAVVSDYPAAERYFKTAISLNPYFAPAYSNLGGIYFVLGRYADAETLSKKALDLDPNRYAAITTLGNVAAAQNDPKSAIAYFEKGLELEPDNPNLHYRLGDLYRKLGDVERAKANFRKVLELVPGHQKTLQALKELGDS